VDTPPSHEGFRFPLSFRDVEELLFERGIQVPYESIRAWCERFGPEYAARLRRRRPKSGDKWHLDEVFIKVNGRMRYLCRAVDPEGNVLGILVTDKQDTAAARRFFRKLLKGSEAVLRVIVADKHHSCGAAHRVTMLSVEHRSSKYLNNRAGNSHIPTRERERGMKGFRSVGTAQRFLSSFSRSPGSHRISAPAA
jgi:putative transposase